MPVAVRSYQEYLFSETKKGNRLVIAPTNSGKTLIASLMIKEFLTCQEHSDKIVVFLAPTQLLASQQHRRVTLDFDSFFALEIETLILTGMDSPVDHDRAVDWEEPQTWKDLFEALEILKNNPTPSYISNLQQIGMEANLGDFSWPSEEILFRQDEADVADSMDGALAINLARSHTAKWPRVFFLTPDKFLNYLACGFISISQICLLIFDECHNASLKSSSPYVVIMLDYVKSAATKPRILGLTATPVRLEVDEEYKKSQLFEELKYLESLFHSKMVSPIGDPSFRGFQKKPQPDFVHYNADDFAATTLNIMQLWFWTPFNSLANSGFSISTTMTEYIVLNVEDYKKDLEAFDTFWKVSSTLGNSNTPSLLNSNAAFEKSFANRVLCELNIQQPQLFSNIEGVAASIRGSMPHLYDKITESVRTKMRNVDSAMNDLGIWCFDLIFDLYMFPIICNQVQEIDENFDTSLIKKFRLLIGEFFDLLRKSFFQSVPSFQQVLHDFKENKIDSDNLTFKMLATEKVRVAEGKIRKLYATSRKSAQSSADSSPPVVQESPESQEDHNSEPQKEIEEPEVKETAEAEFELTQEEPPEFHFPGPHLEECITCFQKLDVERYKTVEPELEGMQLVDALRIIHIASGCVDFVYNQKLKKDLVALKVPSNMTPPGEEEDLEEEMYSPLKVSQQTTEIRPKGKKKGSKMKKEKDIEQPPTREDWTAVDETFEERRQEPTHLHRDEKFSDRRRLSNRRYHQDSEKDIRIERRADSEEDMGKRRTERRQELVRHDSDSNFDRQLRKKSDNPKEYLKKYQKEYSKNYPREYSKDIPKACEEFEYSDSSGDISDRFLRPSEKAKKELDRWIGKQEQEIKKTKKLRKESLASVEESNSSKSFQRETKEKERKKQSRSSSQEAEDIKSYLKKTKKNFQDVLSSGEDEQFESLKKKIKVKEKKQKQKEGDDLKPTRKIRKRTNGPNEQENSDSSKSFKRDTSSSSDKEKEKSTTSFQELEIGNKIKEDSKSNLIDLESMNTDEKRNLLVTLMAELEEPPIVPKAVAQETEKDKDVAKMEFYWNKFEELKTQFDFLIHTLGLHEFDPIEGVLPRILEEVNMLRDRVDELEKKGNLKIPQKGLPRIVSSKLPNPYLCNTNEVLRPPDFNYFPDRSRTANIVLPPSPPKMPNMPRTLAPTFPSNYSSRRHSHSLRACAPGFTPTDGGSDPRANMRAERESRPSLAFDSEEFNSISRYMSEETYRADPPQPADVTIQSENSGSKIKSMMFFNMKLKALLFCRYLNLRKLVRAEFLASTAGPNTVYLYRQKSLQIECLRGFNRPNSDPKALEFLCCTSVLGEGIDVVECNAVLRFDMAQSPLDHFQTWGRARKPPYSYVVLAKQGNHKDRLQCQRLESLQNDIHNWVQENSTKEPIPLPNHGISQRLTIESTGATITLRVASSFLHNILAKLGGKMGLSKGETIKTQKGRSVLDEVTIHEGIRQPHGRTVKFSLPPVFGFRTIEPYKINEMVITLSTNSKKTDMKSEVYLEIIELLHKNGVLDDNLLPPRPDRTASLFKKKQKVVDFDEGEIFERKLPHFMSLSNYEDEKLVIKEADQQQKEFLQEKETYQDFETSVDYYRHFISYHVLDNIHESEVLASGGLFGYWTPDPTDAVDLTSSETPGLSPAEEDRENEKMQEMNFDGHSTFDLNEDAPSLVLTKGPTKVLQPLVLLMREPMSLPCHFLGSHSTTGERIEIEIKSDKVPVKINYSKKRLLQTYFNMLKRSLGIFSFNNSNSPLEIEGAHFLVAPLGGDGKSIDYDFVLQCIKLRKFLSSGQRQVQGTLYKGKLSPSLLEIYRKTDQQLMKKFLHDRTMPLSDNDDFYGDELHMTDNHLRRRKQYEKFNEEYYKKREDKVAFEIWKASQSGFPLIQLDEMPTEELSILISSLFDSRGGEKCVYRMVHEAKRNFHFFRLEGYLWELTPFNYLMSDERSLAQMYAETFKQHSVASEETFLIRGEKLRQGARIVIQPELHPRKVDSNLMAPDFAHFLPLTDAIFQQITFLPVIVHKIEIHAKHIEFSNRLQADMTPYLQSQADINIKYHLIKRALTTSAAKALSELEIEPQENGLAPDWHLERLEFLGDAVLKAITGLWAYFYCKGTEGGLNEAATLLRSNDYLRQRAKEFSFLQYVHGRVWTSCSRLIKNAEGKAEFVNLTALRRQQMSAKGQADIMESLLGALYLSNLDNKEAFPYSAIQFDPSDFASKGQLVADQSPLLGSSPGFVVCGAFLDKYCITEGDARSLSALFTEIQRPIAESPLFGELLFSHPNFDVIQPKSKVFVNFPTNDSVLKKWYGKTFDLFFPHGYPEDQFGIVTVARSHKSVINQPIFCGDSWQANCEFTESYERLEFLGDSLLSMLMTEWLYFTFSAYREGHLSLVKNIIQSNEYLARMFVRRLYNHLGENEDFIASNVPIHLLNDPPWKAIDDLMSLVPKTTRADDFEKGIQTHENGLERAAKSILNLDEETETTYVWQSKQKGFADVYEAFVAMTFIQLKFDLKALWIVLAPDFEECASIIESLCNSGEILTRFQTSQRKIAEARNLKADRARLRVLNDS
eukprot:GHVP01033380.1.p1 GENE.GHVP01033380.1~~GHVP01033380.1.p1  ORF type:complete len:2606 (-),score=489.46 GHVP01033380.1:356-8116(-)